MRVNVNLTEEQVAIIRKALVFALDMADTYFPFAPRRGNYSDGNYTADKRGCTVANALLDKVLPE